MSSLGKVSLPTGPIGQTVTFDNEKVINDVLILDKETPIISDYLTRPQKVRAFCYRGEIDKLVVRQFVTASINEAFSTESGDVGLAIVTPFGWNRVNDGDWIVEVAEGVYVSHRQDIFEQMYSSTDNADQ